MNKTPFLDANDLVFYPGSGNDFIPLLIPAFKNRGESPRTFIYADYDPDVFTFFSSLDSNMTDPEDWRKLIPKYSSFFDSLQLRSIQIVSKEESTSSNVPRLKLLIKVEPIKGRSFNSELQLFQADAETYLSNCHLNIFKEHKINLILHIVQITNVHQHSDRFFGYQKFNQFLNEYPLIRDADYVISDYNKALYQQNWKPVSDYIFNGWGLAGNTLNNFGSALLYKRREVDEEKLSDHDQQNLEQFERRLKELKFEF